MSKTLDQLARERTDSALGVINEVMTDPFAENKDRLRAAIEMLDRGHGKPLAATISVPMAKQKQAQLSKMTDADLMAHLQSTPLPTLLSLPTPDAEFTDVTPPCRCGKCEDCCMRDQEARRKLLLDPMLA